MLTAAFLGLSRERCASTNLRKVRIKTENALMKDHQIQSKNPIVTE